MMRIGLLRFTLLSICLLLSLSYGQAQDGCDFDWARRAGGPAADAANDVVTDAAGNAYVTGRFAQAANFGSSTFTARGTDAFVAKYDPTGAIVWAVQLGGAGDDAGRSLTVDASGNTFVTGTFTGRASFGTFTLFSLGGTDVFLVRIDNSGRVVWAKRAGGKLDDRGNGIAVDRTGFLLLTGGFRDTCGFTGSQIKLPSSGGMDIFSARYSSAGDVIWSRRSGSAAGDDEGWAITPDSTGNTYITGRFTNTATFDAATLVSAGGTDIFIMRRNAADGAMNWIRRAGGTGNDVAHDILHDRGDSLVVVGSFEGTAAFSAENLTSAGGADVFAARYDRLGNVGWARAFGGTGADVASSVSTDATGFFYIGGSYAATATFDAFSLANAGGNDAFVAKFDPLGRTFWAINAGAAAADSCTGVAVNASGIGYAVGLYNGSVDFGPDNLATTTAASDAFVARLCNFTRRFCPEIEFTVRIKNAGVFGDDGEILVENVTGGRTPYFYSANDPTIEQADPLFFDLTPGSYLVYVRDLRGCTDTLRAVVEDECAKSINPRFVGLDTVYCITDPNPKALRIEADETFDFIGFEGSSGINGNEFFPSLATAGLTELWGLITRPVSGCEDTAKISIRILETVPAVIAGLDSFYCINRTDSVKLVGSPSGGVLAGAGVIGEFFYPKLAGNGPHEITYIGDSSNCQFVEVFTTTVVGPDDARIGGLDSLYCLKNQTVDLLSPTPPGGILFGRGITGNLLDPAVFGLGLHYVAYYGSFEGCPYFVTNIISVVNEVDPTFPGMPKTICASAVEPLQLKATPAGGTFFGNAGILTDGTGFVFVPQLIGPGKHKLIYEGSLGGCIYSDTLSIEVTPAPSATITGLSPEYCTSDPNRYILKGTPTGGFFQGQGIQGNEFVPKDLIATFPVVYLSDSAGCTYRAQQQVIVKEVAPNFKGLETVYCATDAPIVLEARPAGGVFRINSVVSTVFDPARGPGLYLITYAGDSATCPYATSKNVLVFAPPVTFLTDLDSAYCITNSSPITIITLPPGGTLRGPGITGNLFVPTDVGRLGEIVIEYFGSDGGCDYYLTDTVQIIGTVQANIPSLENDYCVSDLNSYTLVGSPAGGAFFGKGVIGNQFFPSRVGVGSSQITYVGDSAGCQFVTTRSAFVNMAVPPQFQGLAAEYCSTNPTPIPLVATPEGGAFSGPGVVNDTLYLPQSGITTGNLPLVYAGTFRGCNYSAMLNLRITGECCPTPRLDTVFQLETGSIRTKWYAVNRGRAYEYSYRRPGAIGWINSEVPGSESFVNGLTPCTEYEYRVRTLCLDGYNSEWSETRIFKTPPIECLPPGYPFVERVTSTTALISWTPYNGCLQEYVVEYHVADMDLPWKSIATTDTFILLTGLEKETDYEVRIRSRCASDVLTLPTLPVLFTTLPFDPPPCKQTDSLWLARLDLNEAYIRWTPVGGAAYYIVEFRRTIDNVWISGQVFASEYLITQIERDRIFEVRVRTVCLSGGQSDFKGILRFGTFPGCAQPQNLVVRNVTATQASLFWDVVGQAATYTVRWRPTNTIGAFMERITIEPRLALTNLTPGVLYDVEVSANCGFDTSPFSESISFPTINACPTPTIVSVTPGRTSARVEWQPIPRANSYEVCWRASAFGSTCDTRVVENPAQNFMTNNGLLANTDYVVRVRALCEEGFTPWRTVPFRTTALRESATGTSNTELKIYPNPNRGQFAIELETAAAGDRHLTLSDLSGRIVYSETQYLPAGSTVWPVQLSSVAAGVYLLRINGPDGQSLQKLIVE